MSTFNFRVGNHSLDKGHTKACSAIQCDIAVDATDVDSALTEANRRLDWANGMLGSSNGLTLTFKLPITKRNLIK